MDSDRGILQWMADNGDETIRRLALDELRDLATSYVANPLPTVPNEPTVTEDEGHYLSQDIRRIIGDRDAGTTTVILKSGAVHVHVFGMVYVWEDLQDFRNHA